MGRPMMGREARSVVLATKGTAAEKEALIAKYGSVYEGLRVAVMLALTGNTNHRHRRGEEVDGAYIQGVLRKRYRCAEPGCEEVLG